MSDSPRQVDWQQLLILAEERPPPSNGVRKIVVIVPLVTGLASSKRQCLWCIALTEREGGTVGRIWSNITNLYPTPHQMSTSPELHLFMENSAIVCRLCLATLNYPLPPHCKLREIINFCEDYIARLPCFAWLLTQIMDSKLFKKYIYHVGFNRIYKV